MKRKWSLCLIIYLEQFSSKLYIPKKANPAKMTLKIFVKKFNL